MNKLLKTVVTMLVASAVFAATSYGAPQYTVTDLGQPFAGNSYALGINNRGQIVGYWLSPGGARAFLRDGAGVVDLGNLGGTNDYALSVNAAGQVVGFSELEWGTWAFLNNRGTMSLLENLEGTNSFAYGINDAGHIVGYVETPAGASAFLYRNQFNVVYLNPISYAFGLNASDQVVGTATTDITKPLRAFRWENGAVVDLTSSLARNPGWELTHARAINASGAIVGWGLRRGRERAYLLANGKITDLGVLRRGTNSFAFGLNNSNHVVGATTLRGGDEQAFLWRNGRLLRLNDLVSRDSGWELREARGINDGGDIVGWGTLGGRERAFLLSPVQTLTTTGRSEKPPVVTEPVLRGEPLIFAASGGTTPVTNSPLADAYVRDGTFTNVNFGTNIVLELMKTNSTTANNRQVYFKFGIDNGPAVLGSAILRIWARTSASGSVTTRVYSVTDTNWTETGIKWTNKPALGTIQTNRTFSGTTLTSYDVDITTYVRSELTAGRGIATIALVSTNNTALLVSINSKETNSTSNRPILILNTNANPTVSISAPANNSTFPTPTNLVISATAADTDGTVTNVDFYAGTFLIGRDGTSPFSYTWTNAAVGTHGLTAVAFDDQGAVITSSVVNVVLTKNLEPAADAHTKSDSVTSNFGTVIQMEVQTNSATGPTRDTFFKFNLSGITNISNAKIRVFASISAAGTGSGTYFSVADTNWTETGITWSNQPVRSNVLGHLRVTSTTAAWFTNDITSFVQGEKAAGREFISLVNHSQTNASIFIRINSRETNANRPELVITTTNSAPAVSITVPTNNAPFAAPANISITATATDNESVTQVEFFAGATSLGVVTTPPYIINWNSVAAGSYSLTARATDNYGLIATSAVVNVVSDVAPSVTVTNPANGSSFASLSSITLGASASDSDGTVLKVEFYEGANKLGEDATSPYSISWNNVMPGSYSVTAKATDNLGISTVSSSISVQVNTGLAVVLTNPVSGSVFGLPTNITLNALATAGSGQTVSQVDFYANGLWLGSDSSNPYSVAWTNAIPGTFALTAAVTDNLGSKVYSSAVYVTNTLSPTNISGLRIWLDAGAGVTTNGAGNVSQWSDQSGKANHATQGTGSAQPLFVTNVLNSRPVIRFDGTNDQLVLANYTATNTFSVYVVARAALSNQIDPEQFGMFNPTPGESGQRYLFGGVDPLIYGVSEVGISLGTNGVSDYEFERQSVGANFFNPMAVYAGSEFSSFSLITLSYLNRQPSLQVNGALARAGLVSSRTNVVFTKTIGLGMASQAFSGDVAEILVFDRVLNQTEQAQIIGYLNSRYQLYTTPVAPVILSAAAVSPTQASVSWRQSNTNTIRAGVLERRQGAGSYADIAVLEARNSYFDTNVAASTQYTYRFRSRDFAGLEDYSNEATITTPSTGNAFPSSKLKLWLQAGSGHEQFSVGTWKDINGGTNFATQFATTNRPSVIYGALNGWPAARFDGDDQLMLQGYFVSNNFTVFALAQTTAGHEIDSESNAQYTETGKSGQRYLFGGVVNFDPFGEVGVSIGTNGFSDYEYGRNQFFNDHFAPLAVHSGSLTTNYNLLTLVYSNQQPYLHLNSVLVRSGLQSSRTNSVFTKTIGYGVTGSGASPFIGQVAEIMVFDATLTDTERQVVGATMLGRYGLATTLPPTPTNLVASAVSSNQINLTWTDSADGVVSFRIERKLGSGGTYAEIANVSPFTTSYFDTGLATNTTYYYRVRASNLAGYSPYSNETNATTLVTEPSMPMGNLRVWLKADADVTSDGSGAISKWNDVSGLGNNAIQNTPSNQPVFLTNLVNGRPAIRFDGTNDQLMLGVNPASNSFTIFAVAKPSASHEIDLEDNTLYSEGGTLGQRYLLGGTINFEGFGEAGLSVGTNGFTSYEYGRNQFFWDHFAALAVHDGNLGAGFSILNVRYTNQQPSLYLNGAFVREGLVSSRTNSVLGRAIGFGSTGAGNSPYQGDVAEILVFNTPLTTAERQTVERYLNSKYNVTASVPSAPTNLVAATISSNQISLVWSAASADATEFKVERKTGAGGTYQQIASLHFSVTAYLDSSIAANTTYFYRVRASNARGDSAYSNEANASTITNAPVMPMTNLVLWLKADAETTLDGAGLVNRWLDQSGRGNHANQLIVSNRPTWVASGANGRPAIRLDGSNDLISVVTVPATNNFTVFAVAAPNTSHEIDAEGASQGGDAGQRYLFDPYSLNFGQDRSSAGISMGTNGVSVYEFQYNNIGANYRPPVAVYSNSAGSVPSIVGVSYTGRQPRLYSNGILKRTGLTYAREPHLAPTRIGTADAQTFSGDVFEVLVFDRLLTDEEQDTVGRYLSQRFGIVTNAPAVPTNIVATAVTYNQVNLSWSNGPAIGTVINQVERKTGTNGSYAVIGVVRDGSAYLDYGVVPGVTYVYRIKAGSYFGESAYSAEFSPPITTITNPLPQSVFSIGSNVTVSATAGDVDGSIAFVEFYLDGTVIGTNASGPYGLTLTNPPAGTHLLTSRTKDNQGHTRFSAPIGFTVVPDTDGDGINDFEEIVRGTNPTAIDTDGDGVSDALDAFPLDPTRSAVPSPDPFDTTPPVIILDEPAEATPIP